MLADSLFAKMHLDREILQRDLEFKWLCAEAYDREFFGAYQERQHADRITQQRLEDQLLNAATNFRRAAAHALLINHFDKAQRLFGQAARLYQALHRPYSVIMEALAQRPVSPWSHTDRWHYRDTVSATRSGFRPQTLYYMLSYAVSVPQDSPDEYGIHTLREELEIYRRFPVGILGVPAGVYLDIFDALTTPSWDIDILRPLLERYNEALRQAQSNLYHWRRFAMPFHPAEPDVLGLILLVESASLSKRHESVLKTPSGRLLAPESTLIGGILIEYTRENSDYQH